MRKACFLEGKRSSRAATPAPVPFPSPPTEAPVSGFPLGRDEGSACPLPSCSRWQHVPGHSQVLHAQPAFATLWTLSTLRGQGVPGRGTLGAKPPVSSSCGRWEQFDKKYLSQLLMRKSAYRLRDEIWDVYYKLNIRDAISFVDQVGA